MEDDEHEANSTETDIVGIISINPLISLCLGFTYFFKSPITFFNKDGLIWIKRSNERKSDNHRD